MKKNSLYITVALSFLIVSCKETLNPIVIDNNTADTSYSYKEAPEKPQTKRIYIEELTGVKCINCPAAAEELERLSELETNSGKLSIIAFHTGPLTEIPETIQNLTTKDAEYIQPIWGPLANKPSAVIDRLKVGNALNGNLMFVEGSSNFEPALNAAKTALPNTPVNLTIISAFNSDKNRYEVTATIKYTEPVKTSNALHIYISESKIIDAQWFPGNTDEKYELNHVFRKALTLATTGTPILKDTIKEAGIVFVYKTSFKIDKNDEKQKYWMPENMYVTAFVSIADDPNDIHVLQVQETKLTK